MSTLTLAIAAYQAGLADYNANAPRDDDAACDAYAQQSYLPPLEALRAWVKPATSTAEAELALRTALKEIDEADVDTASVLVRAACGYLKAELASEDPSSLVGVEFEPWKTGAEDVVPNPANYALRIAPRLRIATMVMFQTKAKLGEIITSMAAEPHPDDPENPEKDFLDQFMSDLAVARDFARAMDALVGAATARILCVMAEIAAASDGATA